MEGGVLATAGNLVFNGTHDGRLLAWSADRGVARGEWDIGTAILAAPSSYEVKGEQYIAVAAGYAGAMAPAFPATSAAATYQNYARLVTFKLGGVEPALPPRLAHDTTPEPPTITALDGADADKGMRLFVGTCGACHAGYGNAQRSAYPDLTRLSAATHASFDDIVLRGILKDNGMASFADVLSLEDVRDIHAFLVREQRQMRAAELSAGTR